jgi:catechol 2,3-dioxygenase-like lactoylglutathione lyase family enzyme
VPVVVSEFDHMVLTVADIPQTLAFYGRVLGMRAVASGSGRAAIAFGDKQISLRQAGIEHRPGGERVPHARQPTPGSADVCLVTRTPLETVVAHLASSGVEIEGGPARGEGAAGPVTSVYVRDPDGNLIEIASYDNL